jgi:amino acid adenylation domain-containing protein
MFLLAVYQTLLYRYSGQDDISVGTAIANRTLVDTEPLIGFFVNTLVMRTDLSGSPSVKELLNRVRTVTLGAFAHQDLPFELLVEELQPDRDLSHTPLFQVAFALQNAPTSELSETDLSGVFSQTSANQNQLTLRLSDLELRTVNIDSGTAKFDLTLSMADSKGGLVGGIEYNTDLFDRETIQQLIEHFQVLLTKFTEYPDKSIDGFELLTESESSTILTKWNQTEIVTPVDQCAHQRFEEIVRRMPDATAVTFNGKGLTYEELNRRANQLSHYLKEQGVRPETIVGISTHRSIEMVVAILGVLKAGGAYLPIDPTYPTDRIEFMIRDSQPRIILTQTDILERLPIEELDQPPIILSLDADWEQIISVYPEAEVVSWVVPENIAYVIYTSGSTGLPKGTMLRHDGLSNLAEAQRLAFGIETGTRILQFSPLSFDASVWETFMALANGATLCLAEQEVLASGIKLAEFLDEQEITTVTLPPSVLRVLPDGEYRTLKTVIAAGEACTPDLVERWTPKHDFFNAYGPTETTVCASMYLCTGDEEYSPPIGRPIANTQLYILDENLLPLPIGVPGELHVSGVSVARGYLGRPEMTAQKFIPDPFSRDHGSRLYKTGDLVRYHRDGNIEFLGRIDQQVKVRGFRIELGEVTAALNDSPLVREGVVVAREDVPGDTRLVAYIVGDDGKGPDGNDGMNIAAVRMKMREILPEYMIPSMFIVLDELPYTPSGKVDKQALPPPDTERPILESVYIAPRTETEKMLTEISQELLGIERVGVNDNFFELGGHSLLATQFISRVRESLGVELELRQFFETPTVAEIGSVVDELKISATDERSRISELLSRLNELSDEEVKELLELKKNISQ